LRDAVAQQISGWFWESGNTCLDILLDEVERRHCGWCGEEEKGRVGESGSIKRCFISNIPSDLLAFSVSVKSKIKLRNCLGFTG
jgi:hypothetical protein